MDKLLEAVKEASISVACLLDDIAEDENNDIKVFEIEKDIKHLQDQITIIENYLNPFVVEELNHIKQEKS
tara:strand:+ start:132 stop:341 length:210 start_codon:yes stop_codon:yes gene_type:complete